MKKISKLLTIITFLLLTMALILTGCGNGGVTEDDCQNPVMNFVGTYGCGRATVIVGATDEENGANATITWGSSAAESSEWTMSGTFDTDSLTFEYNDGVRTDYVYNEDGEVESSTEVYRDGHGTMTFKDGDAITMTWKDDVEDAGKDMVFEFSGTAPEDPESGEVGMANPWSDVGSLAEAAEGAGLDGFDISEGSEISLGKLDVSAYRCMDGLAEVIIEFPASEIRIRKGLESAADVGKGDISGDYGEYAKTWTQNIKGLEVTCFGNREGDATKTIWQSGDYYYSITAQGLGGDEDFGLNADDLSSLINGIQ